MSLLPGGHFLENYREALFGGVERVVGVSLERLLFNSLVVALAIAIGKIIISFLSAFAIVFFRFPFRMGFFLADFFTPDAAGRGADSAHPTRSLSILVF